MDTKRLITGMVVVLAIVFGWQALYYWLLKMHPEWAQQPAPAPTTQVVAAQEPASAPTAPTAPAALATAPVADVIRAVASGTIQPAQLGSATPKDERWALALSIVPEGAALDSAILNSFRHSEQDPGAYTFQRPLDTDGQLLRSLATQEIIVNGKPVPATGAWYLAEPATESSVTYAMDVVGERGPVLQVLKRYEIFPRADQTQGYEVLVSHRLVNRGGEPVNVQLVMSGPLLPPRELEYGADLQVIAGYDDQGIISLAHHPVEQFTGDKSVQNLTQSSEGLPVVWAGTSSVYFDAIVLPIPLKGKSYLQQVQAKALSPGHVGMSFRTVELSVAAGATEELPMRVFLGPKQRSLLKSSYYAAAPRGYHLTLSTGGSCAFCTFQWIIDLLVWLLVAFHAIFRDWGLAIIGLVVLVRLILHPITKRSTISMHKMGRMGPEMERLRKKYGDNKDELNRAMMQLYKEQGFTPILGCLPMFLQMPIWIALWSALQGTFELRQAPFLYGLTWIDDLARPDRLISFAPISFFGLFSISALNLLPLLLAVVFWLQQRFTPKPPAQNQQQEQQQKMMQWMTLIFPVFLYNGPSGLNLYILTSTTIGIIESKRIRDHIKQREEAEKAGRVLVDARPTRGSRKLREQPIGEKPKGRFAAWVAQMQEKAEQMRRDQDRKNR